ncbi:type I secretion system permease/ATPase [Sulfitobacter sp. MOLA879]|uniref:type I secretion system permease/ATPase n=1 Tax=Sulfitobacter sp. MOLA879 TaxID=3368579 RepID=UPI0037493827
MTFIEKAFIAKRLCLAVKDVYPMSASNPLQQAYRKFRAIFGATILFSFFVNLLMFVGPLYMLQIYDRVLSSRNEMTLAVITAIAVALLITYGTLEFVRSRMLVRAGLQFDSILSRPLFDRVARMQLVNPASGARTALGDADKVRSFITGQGVLAFFDVPWTPIFLALCFAFHPWLGWVAATGTVVIFTLALLNEYLTRNALQSANTEGQQASEFAGATMQNAEVIRAMGMQDALAERWQIKRNGMLVSQATASDWAGAVMSSSKFVRMALQVAILGTGAYLAMKGEISAGVMIAASIVMGRALAPVEQAVGQWKEFVAARQSNARLKKLFEAVTEEPTRLQQPQPKGHLSAEGVTTVVPGTRDTILRGVSFDLPAGKTLALIGPSGSGKSTLARHLVGVGDPINGAIRLDQVELPHWDRNQLGKTIGYLPQDVKLFSGTVAENISRFMEGATDDDIIAAAKLAGAHEMISGLSDGYATQIGNGGGRLSGGQRQRVGLARALFGNPSLVVLDEPNANLDSEGEEALARCLTQLKGEGKTIVLVTHKANILSATDFTLILREGTVQRFVATKELLQPQQQPQQQKPQQQPQTISLSTAKL